MGLSKTRPACGCTSGVPEAAGTVTSPENVFKSGPLMKMKTSSSRAIFWIYSSTDLCRPAYSTDASKADLVRNRSAGDDEPQAVEARLHDGPRGLRGGGLRAC